MSLILKPYQAHMTDALEKYLSVESPYALYGMMRYFMGFADEQLKSVRVYGGKNFRSALCLLVADLYGNKESALSAAISLELFHNMTLIHDDIVDKDTMRRGRPTLWKLAGIPHAINTGDAQLLLVYRALGEGIAQHAERGLRAHQFATERYLEIAEGQFLDFSLTDLALADGEVTEEAYFTMSKKKTSVLVGAATTLGGIMTGASLEDCERLYAYGVSLGMAVQLNDDYMSIWGDSAKTGKDAHGDIKERKKTLPIVHARDTLAEEKRVRLCELYASTDAMTSTEVGEVLSLLTESGSQAYTEARIAAYLEEARQACISLTCSDEGKKKLTELFDECLPR